MSDFVMLPVPTDRVDDVFALLAAPARCSDTAAAAADRSTQPWADLGELSRFYAESSPRLRSFLLALAEHSPGTLTTTEVAANLLKGTASVAGMLSAAGRRAATRHGQEVPWRSWSRPSADGSGGAETVFIMDRRPARAIREAAGR